MISIRNLNKSYGDNKVFEDYNVDFKMGEISFIMSPSGSGKTTLFKILMGLENYTGEITGMDEKISVLFQENRLIANRSVRDNINFPQKNPLSDELITGELKKLGLNIDLDMSVDELSGGMARRVAGLRALLVEAGIYILDEPFKELDIKSKEKLSNYILNMKANPTILISGHDKRDGERLGANIIK